MAARLIYENKAMKKSKRNILTATGCLFSIICFLSLSCNESPLEASYNYPTAIPVLSEEKLQKLQTDFDETNNYEINVKLNKYGFIGSDASISCPFSPRVVLSRNNVLQLAASTLIKNKKFTNVVDENDVLAKIKEIRNLGDEMWWRIELNSQEYNNLEVLNFPIYVYLFGDKVYCILNSWIPNAFIPLEDKVDQSEAKVKLIGQQIQIMGLFPYGSYFTVNDSSIGEISRKVIVPFETENALEIRVAWEVPIKYYGLIGWYIYVDSTTGEILKTTQEIIFN
jgi:hypothetical protein